MNIMMKERFESYPAEAQAMLSQLRELIIETAKQYGLGQIEESLKWGEPSYLAKGGSAVRIGWKPEAPDKCFVFFHCQTKLVDTFKEIYGDTFQYEGKRAIVIDFSRKFPTRELKHCLSLSMQYHKLKRLPLLGV